MNRWTAVVFSIFSILSTGALAANQAEALVAYKEAASHLKSGRVTAAESRARDAFQIEVEPKNRIETGRWLASRGLFAWADREFKHVADSPGAGLAYSVAAARLHAETLYELGQAKEAAAYLRGYLDQTNENPDHQRIAKQHLSARIGFFQSREYVENGQRDLRVKCLLDALEQDKLDVDVLCALAEEMPISEPVDRQIEAAIDEAIGNFRESLSKISGLLDKYHASGKENKDWPLKRVESLKAANLNRLARILSRSGGDPIKALEMSEEANALVSDNPDHLETLAWCHRANGDHEKATDVLNSALELWERSVRLKGVARAFDTSVGDASDGRE